MNQRMDAFRARIGGIAFGGDYNPEQWDRATWDEDMALMRAAGVNLVTLGVFAWACLEPEPGTFTFDWLDEVMGLLHGNRISVDLATPTAAPPPWLSHEHPEVLPVTEDGHRFGFGNRLHFDPTSGAYRRHAAAITRALAERYSRHPALAMWHIGNEYGPVAYTPSSARAFRAWLRRRYGDLEALNDAWYTRFWSQRYTSWEQVCPPEMPRSWSNPARRLDFARFTSDALLECFTAERDIVRAYSGDVPVLTNFMRFYPRADYWRWAREEDAVALDIYPDPGQPDSHVAAALNFDLARSLRAEPWILMEQAAGAVSQWPVNVPKRPGRMRLGSYQAIAHGADSVLFFQWRASRGGHERFHSRALEEFVAGGGTLVCSFFSGVVDERNQVRQPAYPGAFRTLIGVYIDEYWPARPGEEFGVRFADGATCTADWWQESIHPETASVIARFTSGDLAGRPAVLANELGAGRVVYVGTRLDRQAMAAMLLRAADAAGARPVVAGAPPHVEATRRGHYLFLLNHSATDAAVVTVQPGGTNLITGDPVPGSLTLPPLDVAVLAYPAGPPGMAAPPAAAVG